MRVSTASAICMPIHRIGSRSLIGVGSEEAPIEGLASVRRAASEQAPDEVRQEDKLPGDEDQGNTEMATFCASADCRYSYVENA